MSIIDWSDPDEMLGLLAEYVQDECLEEHSDRERVVFLRELSRSVKSLASRARRPRLTASSLSCVTFTRRIVEQSGR